MVPNPWPALKLTSFISYRPTLPTHTSDPHFRPIPLPSTVENLALIDLSDRDVLVFANRANLRCELIGAVAAHALVTTRHDSVRQWFV